MTDAADPEVMNLPGCVAVTWRPRPGGARPSYVERADGADAVYDYRPGIDASERVVAFDDRIGGRFGDVDWGPAGERLAYVRDGEVRVYDARTDEESTPAPSDAVDDAPRFDPAGERLAFLSARDGGIDVHVVDAAGGAPERVTTGAVPADDRRWAPAWAPDGDRVAYVAAHDRAGHEWADEVHVTSLADGADERLTRGLCVSTTPAWAPDGDRLAFLATRTAEPWYRHHDDLHVYDTATGVAETYPVGASHQYFQQRPQWGPRGDRLHYPVRDRDAQHVETVLVDGDAAGVPTRVTTHDGGFGAGPVVLSPDGSTLAYPYQSFGTPPHPRIQSTDAGTATTVRDPAPDVPDGVVDPERLTYESFDGLRIAATLFRPPGADADDPVPTVVQCHGGGHFQFGAGWHPLEQHLAAGGIAVLAVDFRGSGGYGRPFQALSMGDWGGGQVRDVREAARVARGFDWTTDAVGVYGPSWGGMVTLHAITQFPDVFDAAVEWYGIVDQARGYEGADRLGRLLRERDLGGTPAEAPEAYREASTDWRLDAVTTPLAALHGADDRRVPVVHAELLRDALGDRADVDCEVTIYEGEGHGFRDAATRRDAADRTRAWFDRYLR